MDTIRHSRWLRWAFVPIASFVLLSAASSGARAAQEAVPTEVTAPQSANLLTALQSGFDGATGGWIAPGATLAAVSTPVHSGTGALAVTAAADTTSLLAVSGSGAATLTSASPGARYTSRLWSTAQSTGRNVAATVVFLDSSARPIATATGQATSDAVGSWHQSIAAIGVAPANASFVAAGVRIANVGRDEVHVIDDVELTTSPGGSADLHAPLRTVGNRVVDANGNTVVLRGFTRVGMEGSGDVPGPGELGYAKRWGANIIRLPVSDAFWLSTSCRYDPSYVTKVDGAVAAITSLGMVALVDLHTNTISSCGSLGQQPMADAPDALTFWGQVADRYRDNPLVAFDLYNEPHDITDDVWLNGGSITWKGTTYQAAGMQQMYDAVRATGAENLVIASGTAWGNLFPKTPIAGHNVVYSLHAYTCSEVPPPDCKSTTPYDVPGFVNLWVTPGKSYPVIIGEFGFPNANDGTYNSRIIAVAESHGWGWTLFTWGDATWGPFDLLATAGTGATYEPKPAGMPALAAFPTPGAASSDGLWEVAGVGATTLGQAGDKPVPGDYNGDRVTDGAVWRPSTGDWYVKDRAPQHFGQAGDVPVPADYNRDGTTDLAVWRPSNGNWYINGHSTVHFGTNGDVPVVADFNGDGVPDLAVWRPSNGNWYVRGRTAVHFGAPGDVPSPADVNGNRFADLVVWRPSNGNWYINRHSTVHFGGKGDVPVLGDYNGDRRADVSVWRPSTGTWYVRGLATTTLGVAGDVPVPGQYDQTPGLDRAVWHPPA